MLNKMNAISAVVITYNEEQRIAGCLQSLTGFSDEIIVVDSGSTDKTLAIVAEFTQKFFTRKPDTIIAQINYATSLAQNDWIFCLDADERCSRDLIKKILDLKRNGFNHDAYKVNRLNYYIYDFFKFCGWYPDSKIRLFNRKKGMWGGDEPHYRVIMNPGAQITSLGCNIIHFTYRDLFHQIEKVNRFSSQAATQKSKNKTSFIRTKIFVNPIVRFTKSYFIQKGFLGGTRGFVNSVIAAFDVFSKYAKVWEAQHRKDPPQNY